MANWICPGCEQSVPADWRVCVRCGFDPNATATSAEPQLGAQDAFPPATCLRCTGTMEAVGVLQLHAGSQAAPFLFGNVGDLLVTREALDTFVCAGCGKVEFYAVRSRSGGP